MSTVKKSHASRPSSWTRKKARHEVSTPPGAGWWPRQTDRHEPRSCRQRPTRPNRRSHAKHTVLKHYAVRGVRNIGQLLVLRGCAVGALKLNVYLVTYRDSRELECRTAYADAEAAAGDEHRASGKRDPVELAGHSHLPAPA